MSNPFAREFLDDYFAEAEEHLAVLRGSVLTLEERWWSPDAIKAVQRSLHTLKGLSGMVAFEEVEGAVHGMEGLVRWAVLVGETSRTVILPLLYRGVQFLERGLSSRRGGSAVEDAAALISAFEYVIGPDPAPTPPSSAPTSPGTEKPGEAPSLLEFRFTPTKELVARGVGVEAVRERLSTIGAIKSAAPRLIEGGTGVVFDFQVEVPAGWRPDDDAWGESGVTWSEVASLPAELRAVAARQPVLSSATAGNVVRVDLARLDELMRMVGELVVSRARLDDALHSLEDVEGTEHLPALQETSEVMERQLRALREGVMRVRLVPVSEVFERLRFAIRDVAREAGKEVAVDVEGADTEIDRLVMDRMLEPLLHLVRNAVSHGIEAPAARAQAGKPRAGRIALRAAASGDRIRIEVEDDGAGVDAQAVVARAAAQGVPVPGGPVDEGRILDLLCAPGFSTREKADRTSGRGVGMEVVRSTVRALNGDLSMKTAPKRGTRFIVDLPLTLMIVDALLVRVGGHTMAVPQPVLREVLKVESKAVTPMGDGEIISYRGGVLPLVRLARVFGMDGGNTTTEADFHVLVVGDDGDRIGLAVEALGGLREIVVHPVDDPLVATVGVSGATELSDGRLGLILDAAALTREVRERPGRGRAPAGSIAEA